MGVDSYLPLAKGKGVHCEMESEGSRRQSSDPGNTNSIRHILGNTYQIQLVCLVYVANAFWFLFLFIRKLKLNAMDELNLMQITNLGSHIYKSIKA